MSGEPWEADFIAGLEAKGAAQVRLLFQAAGYPTNFNAVITRWLAEKDQEAARLAALSAAEQAEIARSASEAAWTAARAAERASSASERQAEAVARQAEAADRQAIAAERANTRATIALVIAIISIITTAVSIWLVHSDMSRSIPH